MLLWHSTHLSWSHRRLTLLTAGYGAVYRSLLKAGHNSCDSRLVLPSRMKAATLLNAGILHVHIYIYAMQLCFHNHAACLQKQPQGAFANGARSDEKLQTCKCICLCLEPILARLVQCACRAVSGTGMYFCIISRACPLVICCASAVSVETCASVGACTHPLQPLRGGK